tara:strand:- start:1350 stop:1763 length:414 start_codon:yes stop_codon:yes gene_type:complete
MILLRSKNIYIGKSHIEGYGVFASKKIRMNEIIQECPFIPMHQETNYPVSDVVFELNRAQNIEEFPTLKDLNGLVLGVGSMFNTSLKPEGMSVEWIVKPELRCLEFFATRDIEVGEELLVYYGDTWINDRMESKKLK